MSETIRPNDCPDAGGCIPLLSGFDRLCFGRLHHKRPDPDHPDPEIGTIYNTHCYCIDNVPQEVNDEDSWIFIKGFKAIRQDVATNKLYRPPGYQDTWDFAKVE